MPLSLQLEVHPTREESCFSTYWQSENMCCRRKAKTEFLGVMADFLHMDTHGGEKNKKRNVNKGLATPWSQNM